MKFNRIFMKILFLQSLMKSKSFFMSSCLFIVLSFVYQPTMVAQVISPNPSEIFIGSYTLDFNNTREAKVTIQIPEGFQNDYIGWGSVPAGGGTGITNLSIQPCRVDHHSFWGSQIVLWVNAHMWDGEERIQLIMDTNKSNPYYFDSYYILVADINIVRCQ